MDTVVIDFTSYTENRISRSLVIEFVISLLLKGKEPLIQEVNLIVNQNKIYILYCLMYIDAI